MRLQPSEEQVVQQIVEGLALHRIPVYRVRERFVGRPSEAGIPDLIGWIPASRFASHVDCTPLFIEVKRPGKHRKRPSQVTFINRAQQEGAIAMFATGWDDVVKELAIYGIRVAG